MLQRRKVVEFGFGIKTNVSLEAGRRQKEQICIVLQGHALKLDLMKIHFCIRHVATCTHTVGPNCMISRQFYAEALRVRKIGAVFAPNFGSNASSRSVSFYCYARATQWSEQSTQSLSSNIRFHFQSSSDLHKDSNPCQQAFLTAPICPVPTGNQS